MKKKKMIKRIKEVIAEWGSTSSGELGLESSPCVNSVGKITQLAEKYNLDDVVVIAYDKDGNELDETYVPYENLSKETITEIYDVITDYELSMQKTMDSCRNENV